VGVI
ncbi:hypothetical protein LDE34_10785, partial [Mycobacterium tuberculosis]